MRTWMVSVLLLPGPACSVLLDMGPLGDAEPVASHCQSWEFMVDGACLPLTECAHDEYEAAPASATQDRLCLAVSRCQPGEYELAPPGPRADRLCVRCPEGTFTSTENASHCEGPSPSAGGAPKHPSSQERSDGVALPCDSDPFELDKQCVRPSDCLPGTYVAAVEIPTGDRICEACPEGTFSSAKNSTDCQEWQQCPPDQVESDDPDHARSSTQDRVCVSCGAGKFAQAGRCFSTTPCQDDQYETVPASATANRECGPCHPDVFVDGERRCSPVGYIQNYWALDWFLNIEGGALGATYVDLGWASTQWSLEPIDGYYRIRHRYERTQFLHIERGELEVGPIAPAWQSARWRLIDVTSRYRTHGDARVYQIQNMHDPEVYLHVETGVLEAGPIGPGWHSAVWYLPPL